MSVTSCLAKAAGFITDEDQIAVLDGAEKARQAGRTSEEGARAAVDSLIAQVEAQIANPPTAIVQAPSPAPVAAPATVSAPTSVASAQKRADALAKIGSILNQPGVSEPVPSYGGAPAPSLTREQEQALMPVLADLMEAAVDDGMVSFKDAARFALTVMRDAPNIGAAVDRISLKNLQASYIQMTGRLDGAPGLDDIMAVAAVKTKAEIESPAQEKEDAPDSSPDLESDQPNGQQPAVAPPVQPGPGSANPSDGQAGRAAGGARSGSGGGSRVSTTRPLAAGTPSNPGLFEDEPAVDLGPAGGPVDERGDLDGSEGPPSESLTDEGTEEATRRSTADDLEKLRAQRAAESIAVVRGDIQNIRDTLPVLLPQQQDDVLFIEQRLGLDDGYGVLITNGTGTGKTFVSLGAIKRLVKQGKNNILIFAPSEAVINGWIRSAPMLGLDINRLTDTKDAGKGVVITTYANLRDNNALIKRNWDLVVADEAQMLSQNADGEITDAGHAYQAITMHPDGARQRTRMKDPDLAKDLDDLSARLEKAEKNKDRQLANLLSAQMQPLWRRFNVLLEQTRVEIDDAQGANRTRALWLSATPFAYEKSVRMAQGYLFDWNKNFVESSGYNAPDPYQAFMIQHFGYRMRTGKLNEPDGTKVDRGYMQRQFNTWLKREKVLSGRSLDSEFDYDRRFVAANSDVGRRIDEAFAWFWDTKPEDLPPLDIPEGAQYGPAVSGAMSRVRGALRKNFDDLSRMRMLEALKAEAAVPYIQAQMDLGRKVVVFHDLIQGKSLDPFGMKIARAEHPLEAQVFDIWAQKFADLVEFDWGGLKSPILTMREAFGGDVAEMNGTVPKKKRQANLDRFNDDKQGPMVLVVQSALEAGWSGHDTTGQNQRVVVNLGLPVRPTQAIQQEGRIYRVGQASNAMFRYFNTQTSWEREAFAHALAQRAAAAENLALGEEARGLLDSYIEAFEATDDWTPGFEGEGTGGKARDREMAALLSDYDRAKTLYWGQQKKTQRNKAEEGVDYFPTPEPVGLKMVEWLDLRPSEAFLEPSAGHGSIARWAPETVSRLAVEPSPRLAPRLALAFHGTIRAHAFEDLHAVNKADGIAMNPPYNKPGAKGAGLAFEHLAKAFNEHLNPGGRIVALLPEGPAADARMDKFLHGTHERPVKPAYKHPTLGEIYRGDIVTFDGDGSVTHTVVGMSTFGDSVRLHQAGTSNDRDTFLRPSSVTSAKPMGKRTESAPNAEGAHVVATIRLPGSTFGRAGTAVRTRIVVIDKLEKDQVAPARVEWDFSNLESVEGLFDEIESMGIPERTKPRVPELDDASPADALLANGRGGKLPVADKQAAKSEKKAAQQSGDELAASKGLEITEHTVQKSGKVLRGVVFKHVDKNQVQSVAPYSFSKDGGVFIRLEHLAATLEAFPLPPVANEERAVYAVNEPDANYDLFGKPVQTDPRGDPPRRRAAPRGDIPAANALSVRQDPYFPGVYHTTSQLVEVSRRELPVARIRSWNDAAAALSSLTRWAVEHFDVLVTDAAGKPLALIGAFKGAPTQTSVYPGVVLMEAMRIKGAAAAWCVHNHPSGVGALSDADRRLSYILGQSFQPSAVQWMGLASVVKDASGNVRFEATGGPLTADSSGLAVPGLTSVSVPIVERTIMDRDGDAKPLAGNPDNARMITRSLAAVSNRPRLLLLNSQNMLTAHIDLDPETAGSLSGNGNFDRLINSASEAGASAVIVANPGDALSSRQLDNIASALQLADIRILDVINPDTGSSTAAKGENPRTNLPVLSGGFASQPVDVRDLRKAIAEVTIAWSRDRGLPDVQVVQTAEQLPEDIRVSLRSMKALQTTRGLMMPDGRVFLVANNIGSVDDGMKVLFHEVYGHWGMRAFLGDSYYNMMATLRLANPKLSAEADAWHKAYAKDQIKTRVERGMSPSEAERVVRALSVEEALADRADGRPPKNWRLVMARLQRALREMGYFGMHVADWLEGMTEAETYSLLNSARLAVEAPHVNRASESLGGEPALSQAPRQPELRPLSMRAPTARDAGLIVDAPASLFDIINTTIEAPLRLATETPARMLRRALKPGVTRAAQMLDGLGGDPGRAVQYIRAGFTDKYGLTDEYIDAKTALTTAKRVGARKTKELIDKLQALSFEQSRIAYLWMSDKTQAAAAEAALFATLPEDQQALLTSIKADIEHLQDEAVRFGLVSPESRERNRNAYLHRSYNKFVADERLASQIKSRSVRLLGDVLKGRGMRDDATMSQIAHSDWWQRKTNGSAHDPSLKGQKFIRLERREKTPDVDTPQLFEDENGQPLGKLREIMYWPADEAIPARFADWRNDGTWEARFFDKSSKVGMWRDFTLPERTKMGEVQEVRFAVATTLMQMVRDIETAKFLDFVTRTDSVAAPEAGGTPQIPEGHTVVVASTSLMRSYLKSEWVQVPDSKIPGTAGVPRFGRLAGRLIPGPVWNDIRQLTEFVDPASPVALWDGMMRAWKISKTALSPVTHMNNVMSNFMFADMHDLQGRHIYLALRAWATQNKDPAMKKLVEDYQDNGGDAGMFNEAEVRAELYGPLLDDLRKRIEGEAGHSLLSAAQVLDLFTHGEFRKAWAAIGETKQARAVTWAPKKLMKLYGVEDEVFRLAAYIKAREDGLSDHDSGKFARESFLNYEINAPWINAMRRTAWPFISFAYRGAPMLAKAFATKPHKFVKYALVGYALNAIAYAMLGDDGDEEKERAWLADEKAGKVWGFMTPKLMRMPWNDKNGSPVFLDVRRWVPMGDIVDTGQSKAAIPMIPPLQPGGPAELLFEIFSTGKSAFTGKDITLRTDELAEKWAKTADYTWKGVMPNNPLVPWTYSQENLIKAARGQINPGPAGQEKASMGQAAMSAFGVKLGSYPTEVQRRNYELGIKAEVGVIKSEFSSKAGAATRSGQSDEEKAAEIEQATKAAQAKIQRRMDDINERRRASEGGR